MVKLFVKNGVKTSVAGSCTRLIIGANCIETWEPKEVIYSIKSGSDGSQRKQLLVFVLLGHSLVLVRVETLSTAIVFQ